MIKPKGKVSLPISIVIPNGRIFPWSLLEQLLTQVSEGDEIIIVRNSAPSYYKNWVGMSSGEDNPALLSDRLILSKRFPHISAVALQSCRIISLSGNLGAAAARNLGWCSSKNFVILFLDDDVSIGNRFLEKIRETFNVHGCTGVTTFRVLDAPYSDPSASIIATSLSLDRGPSDYHSSTPLRIKDVWNYGAGAAMLVDRSTLIDTGGFKDRLGAGCPNGGTEDTEFLWHSSRHTSINYRGRISVLHNQSYSFEEIARKMMEYGRAIGNLGGLSITKGGFDYVNGYCSHIREILRKKAFHSLTPYQKNLVRDAVDTAISETQHSYRLSSTLIEPNNILCNACRGSK